MPTATTSADAILNKLAEEIVWKRLVGGNLAFPNVQNKISGHDFIAGFKAWANGDVLRASFIANFNLTHADDSAEINLYKTWYDVAETNSLSEAWLNEFERRIVLGRDKQSQTGSPDLNGKFGYATRTKLIDGADGTHSLKSTGTVSHRFINWASA